ncbi:hypothetical protein SAMN05216390_102364 [Lachnospiraceae bacterium KH1T2]|nr:hypothetical protein SAMN05216390_102364 [Lachnospiraceae bacterium KH1T2]
MNQDIRIKDLINNIPLEKKLEVMRMYGIDSNMIAVPDDILDVVIDDNVLVNNRIVIAKKMAEFIVELYKANIDSLCDGFNSVREDRDSDLKSRMEAAVMIVKRALTLDGNRKIQQLDYAADETIGCINAFYDDLMRHIDAIRKIHTQSNVEFFFKSRKNLKDCKYEMKGAINKAKLFKTSYGLLFTIQDISGDDTSRFQEDYSNKIGNILSSNNCLLMAKYCEAEQDKQFWYSLSEFLAEELAYHIEESKIGRENRNCYWNDDLDEEI